MQNKKKQLLCWDYQEDIFSKVDGLLHRSKYEFSYDNFSPKEKSRMARLLQKLIQRVGTLYNISQTESLTRPEIVEKFVAPLKEPMTKITEIVVNKLLKIQALMESNTLYQEEEINLDEILHEFELKQQEVVQNLQVFRPNETSVETLYETYYVFSFIFHYLEFISTVGEIVELCLNLKQESRVFFPPRFFSFYKKQTKRNICH